VNILLMQIFRVMLKTKAYTTGNKKFWQTNGKNCWRKKNNRRYQKWAANKSTTHRTHHAPPLEVLQN
jgi:hypothetical protein